MKRTTIVADEALINRLKRAAAARGVSMAQLIREALEEKARAVRPKPASGGSGRSGHSDTGRLSGEVRPEPRPWR